MDGSSWCPQEASGAERSPTCAPNMALQRSHQPSLVGSVGTLGQMKGPIMPAGGRKTALPRQWVRGSADDVTSFVRLSNSPSRVPGWGDALLRMGGSRLKPKVHQGAPESQPRYQRYQRSQRAPCGGCWGAGGRRLCPTPWAPGVPWGGRGSRCLRKQHPLSAPDVSLAVLWTLEGALGGGPWVLGVQGLPLSCRSLGQHFRAPKAGAEGNGEMRGREEGREGGGVGRVGVREEEWGGA